MTGSGGARASAAPAYSAFAPEAFTARAKSSVSSRNTTAERAGSAATPSYERSSGRLTISPHAMTFASESCSVETIRAFPGSF